MKSLTLACAMRLAVAHLVLTATGCEVTPEKIQIWKESENGAPKLRAAVRDDEQPLRIRVMAADALAELAHFDPLAEDLRSLAPADRSNLTAALVKSLLARMEGVSRQDTTRIQEQAKDALFTLRGGLDAKLRAEVDLKVLRWVLGDWARRRGGDHAGEKIAAAVGAPAAPALIETLSADPSVIGALAPLLRSVASPAQRELAAEKVNASLAAQKEKKCPRCPERAVLVEALGRLGAANGRRLLLDMAVSSGREGREEAIAALALSPDESLIAPMTALAADSREEGALRDAAVLVLEKVGGEPCLKALAGLMGHKEKLLRYRAGEAMVTCCGAQGVAKLLKSLPSSYAYAKEDVEDFVIKEIRDLGDKALPPLREVLDSPGWWLPRAIAAQLLGDLGKKDDLPRLTKAVDDDTRLQWGDSGTLGALARSALERLQKRLSAM